MVDEGCYKVDCEKVAQVAEIMMKAFCKAKVHVKPVELLVATQILLNRMIPPTVAFIVPEEDLSG